MLESSMKQTWGRGKILVIATHQFVVVTSKMVPNDPNFPYTLLHCVGLALLPTGYCGREEV